MCRHKGYTPTEEVHISRWNLEDSSCSYQDNYYATAYMQLALTAGLPLIMRNEEGKNLSVDAFWGILPLWEPDFAKAKIQAGKFVNIRSETVKEMKLYGPLLKKKQRCLIPVSCYFEHHHFDQYGKKGQLLKSRESVPFLVKAYKRPLFSIPALYSEWYDRENKRKILSYSMFTIVANDLMGAVHNGGENSMRMPLVIEHDMEDHWLDPRTPDIAIDEILNFQIGSDKLRVHAVAPLTGKAAKEGEAILEEHDWGKYNEEIKEIQNTGRSPVLRQETEPV